ncbi:MAG: hypothetical protein ACJ72N_17975 [Labedaea sp.]
MSDGYSARVTVANLLIMVRHGGWTAAARCLDSLVATDSSSGRRLRSILTELIDLAATLVLSGATPIDDNEVFELDVRGEDESLVDIDLLEPPLRATMRALLAKVNGCPADTADQIDLVLVAGPMAGAEAVLTVLQWTDNLLRWCRRNNIATPNWIAA